ncbi:MAG TPA: ABC transporter substrate-binding protein [Dongiaceae bacterium]|jgi:branched-chain amino acid transport system substrate-binding protein|nr:ABC transporter substrate-binding protein [Dongiaceae bacterium]
MNFRKQALLSATALLAASLALAGCGEEKKEEQAAAPAAEPAQPAAEPAQPAPTETQTAATTPAAPSGQDVKVGILFDVTGPIANFIPPMLDSVTLATDEVNAGGGLLGGKMVSVIGDTTGASQGAVDAATKLVNVENVAAIVGALMSGTTIAAANSVIVPTGVTQISPTATSPDMTTLADNDWVFRVVPSDAYQGQVLAKLTMDQGVKKVALTYANNDYAAPLAKSFSDAYKALGGTITAEVKHEEKQPSYTTELATLAKDQPEALVIIAYAGDSGLTLVKEALENGLFKRFIGTDGLRDNLLIEKIGADNLKDSFFTSPSSPKSEAADKFEQLYAAKFQSTKDKIFIGQVYDSVMLAALAIQQAGSTDRTKVRDALRTVANPPGEAVGPGDWAKAVELIKAGKDIDYTGATGSMDFDDKGDVAGVIGHFVIDGTGYKEVGLVTP